MQPPPPPSPPTKTAVTHTHITLTLETVELQRPCQLSVFTRRLPRDDNHPGADGAAIGPESNYPDCLKHSQATTPQLEVTAEGSRATSWPNSMLFSLPLILK